MLNEKNTLLEDDGIDEVKDISLEEDGIEEEILVVEDSAIVNAMWGNIGGNIKNQTDLQNALDAKQDKLTESQLNAVNSGITAEKVTTYDGYAEQIAGKADKGEIGQPGPAGPQGEQGEQGPAGTNGADGFSPTATVVRTENGATIAITDAQGTTTAEVYDGNVADIPIASADVLGAIKVGSNLSITADGTLSADAQQVTLYSSTGQNTDGAMTQKATTDALALKADSSSLAPVATSGDYNDLNNLPTPPTVNNGALTIKQNGTTLDTFTANSSDNKTVNIQTITAETVAPAEEVGAITTNMIADGAVTNTKIDFSTFIKTGTAQVEYQGNGTGGGFVNVTFDTPFAHTPIVFAQDVSSNGSVSSLTVSNVTATGFRVLARTTLNQSSGTAAVNWLAFSQQG